MTPARRWPPTLAIAVALALIGAGFAAGQIELAQRPCAHGGRP